MEDYIGLKLCTEMLHRFFKYKRSLNAKEDYVVWYLSAEYRPKSFHRFWNLTFRLVQQIIYTIQAMSKSSVLTKHLNMYQQTQQQNEALQVASTENMSSNK